MPGTHHTALYQTDFIRATKKKGSRPRSPRPHQAPSPGRRDLELGGSSWTLSPRAARDASQWPGRRLGSCYEAKGADALPPLCSWARVLPCRGPQCLLSPTLQGDCCRAVTTPQPLPYSLSWHGGDSGLSSLLPFPGQQREGQQDTQTGANGWCKRQDSIVWLPWPS